MVLRAAPSQNFERAQLDHWRAQLARYQQLSERSEQLEEQETFEDMAVRVKAKIEALLLSDNE